MYSHSTDVLSGKHNKERRDLSTIISCLNAIIDKNEPFNEGIHYATQPVQPRHKAILLADEHEQSEFPTE